MFAYAVALVAFDECMHVAGNGLVHRCLPVLLVPASIDDEGLVHFSSSMPFPPTGTMLGVDGDTLNQTQLKIDCPHVRMI